jgi:hypothetical protein
MAVFTPKRSLPVVTVLLSIVVVVFYPQVETGVYIYGEHRFQLSMLHRHCHLSCRFLLELFNSVGSGCRRRILPRTVPMTCTLDSSQLTRALSSCRVEAALHSLSRTSDFAVPWQRSGNAPHNIGVIFLRDVAQRGPSSSQRLVQKLLLCERHPPEDAHA